jgi:hypothetical protein
MEKPSTSVPYGVAGANLGPGGRIESPYGLKSRVPSAGYKICPACEGSGEGTATSLVHVPCPKCSGAGQVEP